MTTLNPKRSKPKSASFKNSNAAQPTDNAQDRTKIGDIEGYQPFRFSFGEAQVRAATKDDNPIFLHADACRALGLAVHNRSYVHHLRSLGAEHKVQIAASIFNDCSTLKAGSRPKFESAQENCESPADAQGPDWGPIVWALTESGLYTLIVRNREATTSGTTANRFLHWVTAEVLPAIRKTGSFTTTSQPDGQDTITIDLREEARWVVINFPGKKPIIRRTPVDGLLDEWSALDTQILAAQIQMVHALWQKAEMIRSFGDDPAGSPMYDHLGTSISEAARLAREYRLAIITRPE